VIRRILPLVLCFTLVTAACSDDIGVGDESLFEFDDAAAKQLGGSSTTTAPPVEATIPEQTTTTVAGETTTTVVQATTTLPPEQEAVSIEIVVQDDDQGEPFDPRVVAIPVNGKVRFVNRGTVDRTVVADNGAFNSGPIAPGAVWIWTATAAGTYNYTDGARPYAVGTIDVQ
jgi:plastocyanin